MTWEWMVRQRGEASVRQSIENLRAVEGDAAAECVRDSWQRVKSPDIDS